MKRAHMAILVIFAIILTGLVWPYLQSGSKSNIPSTTKNQFLPKADTPQGKLTINTKPKVNAQPSPSGDNKHSGESAIANKVSGGPGAKIKVQSSPPNQDLRPVIAKVRVANKLVTLTPDPDGNFQRLVVPPDSNLSVEVQYPNGSPGDCVVVVPVDGGRMHPKYVNQKLDSDKQLSFPFAVNRERGTYRITLRKDKTIQVLDFWVGN